MVFPWIMLFTKEGAKQHMNLLFEGFNILKNKIKKYSQGGGEQKDIHNNVILNESYNCGSFLRHNCRKIVQFGNFSHISKFLPPLRI